MKIHVSQSGERGTAGEDGGGPAGGEERAAEVVAWGGGVGGGECQYNLLTQQ